MVWQAVPATLFTETPRRDQPTTKTSALPSHRARITFREVLGIAAWGAHDLRAGLEQRLRISLRSASRRSGVRGTHQTTRLKSTPAQLDCQAVVAAPSPIVRILGRVFDAIRRPERFDPSFSIDCGLQTVCGSGSTPHAAMPSAVRSRLINNDRASMMHAAILDELV
jgi:hypothetical protein